MSNDDRRRAEYLPNPVPNPGRNFLGRRDEESHFRGDSLDLPADHEYDNHLARDDSHSRLQPVEEGYNIQPAYPTPPAAAPLTGYETSNNRVHYPPTLQSPYHRQEYTSVPLNDHLSPVNNQPHSTPAVAGGSSANASPMASPMLGSGQNTPNGTASKKKSWSFLPMHHSNPSSIQGDNEKPKRPKNKRGGSWDLLGDKAEWEEFNPAQASVTNLRFAQGDAGTNAFSRFYYWALNKSIVLRWILYIAPVTALLWIPGIVQLAGPASEATVWNVPLVWWSVWLTVFWVGFWASTAIFRLLPYFYRGTVGVIIPSARAYTPIVQNLGKYAKLIFWLLASWIAFQPLIIRHYNGDQNTVSRSNLTLISSFLFGLFLCSIVLGVEKLLVQIVAFNFHKESLEDRLEIQKFNVKCLATLYVNSHDIVGRSDTLKDKDASSHKTNATQLAKAGVRKALKGLRAAATNTTNVLGNVASEMAQTSVLQTNSPTNKITAALGSAGRSKALSRRLFYSFRKPGAAELELEDIARFFPDLETAERAFGQLDVDGNGGVDRDEMETAIVGMHRERLNLEHSARDIDFAVKRLDDIFLIFVTLISILILAATITTKLTALVTSAGTLALGLSWLLAPTAQEILSSCIFVFVKHCYDVGDKVIIDGNAMVVIKQNLLSSNFRRVDGSYIWIAHVVLGTKVIENVRRSGPVSETFVYEVAFDTSWEQLKVLREKMLQFCKENSRDYQPAFDVIIDDFPGQSKMVCKSDIKYKSSAQNGSLKVQRRNKWIVALRNTLAELRIWGPAGAGDPSPAPADPIKYTLVPYETLPAQVKPESPPPTFQSSQAAASTATRLTDRREVVNDPSQNIYADDEDFPESMGPSRAATPGPGTPTASTGLRQRPGVPQHPPMPGESIEMSSTVDRRRI